MKDRKIPLYIKIYNELKSKIITKEYKEGEKLPSIRKLAQNYNVNNITIINSYNLLEKEEYVYKKQGSGTYVNNKNIKKDILEEEPSKESFKYGRLETTCKINFANSNPNGYFFPITDFKSSINHVIDRDQEKIFAYEDPMGYSNLRKEIFLKLKKDGIDIEYESLLIVSGAQQGIDIVVKSLINVRDEVIVEEPSYSGAIASLKKGGAKVIGVPLLKDGMDLVALEKILKYKNIKLIYLMTIFHNPTGISYSEKNKKKILKLAKKYNFYIIEDDSSSDLYYDKKIHPLKYYDKDDRVIYIKSYSRIFMPGLRLGYLITPKKKKNDIFFTKYRSDIATPGLIQRSFEHYFSSKLWEKHTEKLRVIYKKKFEISYNLLKDIKGIKIFTVPKGGLYFWIKLEGITSEALFLRGLEEEVSILPGSIFHVDNNSHSWIRLCFADVKEGDIKTGISILDNIIQELGEL